MTQITPCNHEEVIAEGGDVLGEAREATPEPDQCVICGTYTNQREMWAGMCLGCYRKLV